MIHSFSIDDGKLTVDTYEISKYPLIALIYNRDNTTTKEYAHKELMYIHFIADRNGYCNKAGLSAKASHEYAKNNALLPSSYKPDVAVLKAIDFVKDQLQITVVEDLIISTLKALNISGKVVRHITNSMEDILEDKEFNPDDLIKLESNLKSIIKLSNEVPDRVKNLGELQATWRKQSAGVDTIRGGNQHSSSYDGEGEGTVTNSEALHIEE